MNTEFVDDTRRAREEYQQLIDTYDHDEFLANCRINSRRLIENSEDGARHVADEAMRALSAHSPFMMVRIGDGEANLLRFAVRPDSFEKKWVDAIFQLQDNQALAADESMLIADELRQLLIDADVVGLRPLGPLPISLQLTGILHGLNNGDIRAALGAIGCFRHAERAARNGDFAGSALTSAWVHLGLLDHLGRLLDGADRVIVITGRQELEQLFRDRLQGRLRAFLSVPLQASDQADPDRPFHYPHRYREIIDLMREDLQGTLVLVGAGLFGKKYCAVAKRSGAVALDMGSAFDILAGKRTRTAHSSSNFLDTERETWLTTVSEPAGSGLPHGSSLPNPTADPFLGFECAESGTQTAAADGADRLCIPSVTIGTVRYSAMVITIESMQIDKAGSKSDDGVAIYNPADNQMSIPAKMVGRNQADNLLCIVRSLVSINSVSGADIFNNGALTIPSVEFGNTIYCDVIVTVRRIVSIGGGMPALARDSYDSASNRLTSPAIQYRDKVYTNVVLVIDKILSAGSTGPRPTPGATGA